MGELRELNQHNKLAVWAERVAECRASGQSVLSWCKEHGICSQTYYKWQKRLYTLVEAQQEVQFAEVTAAHRETAAAHPVGITIHIGGAAVDVHGGADMATLERVLRMLKSC